MDSHLINIRVGGYIYIISETMFRRVVMGKATGIVYQIIHCVTAKCIEGLIVSDITGTMNKIRFWKADY